MRSTAFLRYKHFLRIIVYFIHYFSSQKVPIHKQILTPFSASFYFFFIVYTSFNRSIESCTFCRFLFYHRIINIQTKKQLHHTRRNCSLAHDLLFFYRFIKGLVWVPRSTMSLSLMPNRYR